MAGEVEVERLVTRLILDDKDHRAGMEVLLKLLDRVAKVDRDLEDQEKRHNESRRKGSQVLRTLSQDFHGLTSALGVLNPKLGFAAQGLINVISLAGRAAQQVAMLRGSLAGIGGAGAAGVGAGAGSGGAAAALGGIGIGAMLGVGIPVAIGAAVIGGAYWAAKEERDEALYQQRRVFQLQQAQLGRIRAREAYEVSRPVLVSHEAGIGRVPFARSIARAEMETEEELRRLAIQEDTEQFRMAAASKKIRTAMQGLRGQENLVGWAGIKQAFLHPWETPIERPMHTESLAEGRQELERGKDLINQITLNRERENDQLERTKHALEAQRWDSITDAMTGLIDKAQTALMSDISAQRYQFARANALDQMSGEQARMIMGEYGKQQARGLAADTALEIQGLGFKKTAMARSEREMLDPLNVELRVTNQLREAQDQYYQQHMRHMPERLSSAIRMNAEQKEHVRLVQEGRAVYDQFMLPIERAAMDRARLKQQFEAGGFGKGPAAEFAYLRAQQSAYGAAHKDYLQLTSATPNQALASHTGELLWSYYQYQRGTTPIPAEMIQGTGKAPGLAVLKEGMVEGETGAGANKESADKQLAVLKEIAATVLSMLDRGNGVPTLAPAMVVSPGA